MGSRSMRRCVVGLCVVALGGLAFGQDLRVQYGTDSTPAAVAIEKAIRLIDARDPEASLVELEKALTADPSCNMAKYWKATALNDLGRVDEAIQWYQRASIPAPGRPLHDLELDAALNAALTYSKLGEYDQGNLWFSRALAADPLDTFQIHAKAYRNMAINLKAQGDPDSATLAAFLAYQANQTDELRGMVRAFGQGSTQRKDAVKVFFAETEHPDVPLRHDGSLAVAELAGLPTEPVRQLVADPLSPFVLAVGKDGKSLWLLPTKPSGRTRRLAAPGQVSCASVRQGRIFAALASPLRLAEIRPDTGAVVQSWDLPENPPASLAVLPSRGLAFCADLGGTVTGLNLRSGKAIPTEIPGMQVVASPDEQFLFTFTKDLSDLQLGGQLVIDGRPIFFRPASTSWHQSTLFKSLIHDGGLLLAEVRENAASNGQRLNLGAQGDWVALAGGGGWRPDEGQGGYGVAVFDAGDLRRLRGFFPLEVYPNGVAIDSVTGHVAAVCEDSARIYHLSSSDDPQELPGPFTGEAVWAPGGEILYLATPDGVAAWTRTVERQEEAAFATYRKKLQKALSGADAPEQASAPAPRKPIENLKTYQPGAARKNVPKLLAQAIKEGQSTRPPAWTVCADYASDETTANALRDAQEKMANLKDTGLAIFVLRKLAKSHPRHAPALCLLGQACAQSGQKDKARAALLEAIQIDAGRTDVSRDALNALAAVDAPDNADVAMQSLAFALYLDRGNPQTQARIRALAGRNKAYAALAAQLEEGPSAATQARTDLPPLPLPPARKDRFEATQLFELGTSSTVLIETDGGTGSGTCVVDSSLILTNDHVIKDAKTITVYPFVCRLGKPVRMPGITATVLHRSPEEDLAVLSLTNPPPFLVPLAVAEASPRPGTKVFAVGNPGMGDKVLEQTFSEGIVSSAARTVDEKVFLQHTAAINPGNSGGPLLNEYAEVVGVTTLKANLAGVGFAVPVERIRQFFGPTE